MCCLASFARTRFRLYRYGAKAPVQTTSSIITSKAEEFAENVRASWEYEALGVHRVRHELDLDPSVLRELRHEQLVAGVRLANRPVAEERNAPAAVLLLDRFRVRHLRRLDVLRDPRRPRCLRCLRYPRFPLPRWPARRRGPRRRSIRRRQAMRDVSPFSRPFLKIGGQCPHGPTCGIERRPSAPGRDTTSVTTHPIIEVKARLRKLRTWPPTPFPTTR